MIGVLSIHTTEGLVDITLDLQSADAMVSAIQRFRSKLEPTYPSSPKTPPARVNAGASVLGNSPRAGIDWRNALHHPPST